MRFVLFEGLLTRANNEDDEENKTSHELLYSCTKVSPTAPCYPRLVLPRVHQDAVIRGCHKEVISSSAENGYGNHMCGQEWEKIYKKSLNVVQYAKLMLVGNNMQDLVKCHYQTLRCK